MKDLQEYVLRQIFSFFSSSQSPPRDVQHDFLEAVENHAEGRRVSMTYPLNEFLVG